MSLIDVPLHDFVGSVAGVPVYLPFEDVSNAEFDATMTDLVLGGGSGEMTANVLPIISAVVSAVEFELFDRSWNLSRNFRNFFESEGFIYSVEDIDFADYDENCEPWSPVFTGDEWWSIGLLAREAGYTRPTYRNVEHWLMVQTGRLYLNAFPDYVFGGTGLEREAFSFAVKRIRSLYLVDTVITQ